ncbi:44484_t:CDS:2 [Gigaspora margarita]|uniref:44484_t:CDS:1 n=1 Tax=Gigaspora margarita TaxID=4874 RepID=A0ABM8W1A2_GIGMA|nr:44484_t:CDS:2 [Gigaspora margarita]
MDMRDSSVGDITENYNMTEDIEYENFRYEEEPFTNYIITENYNITEDIEYKYFRYGDIVEENELEEGKFLGVDNINERIVLEDESSSNDSDINKDNESDLLFSKETINYDLFSSKTFLTWDECDLYLHNWSRRQGFYMKKDRIMHENGIIRWCTYLCNHSSSYSSKSKKDTKKSNFLFKALDENLEKFLTPIVLQRQSDKINQSVYYDAAILQDEELEANCEPKIQDATNIEIQQITLKQVIVLVGGLSNVTEIWIITVCNHEPSVSIIYLCTFNQDNQVFLEKSQNLFQQRTFYGELHGITTNKSKIIAASQAITRFIKRDCEDSDEESDEESDKEPDEGSDDDKENQEFVLQNLKRKCGKGRPAGTKCLKLSHEQDSKKKQQRHCKKCDVH